jgi:hypothetical protein
MDFNLVVRERPSARWGSLVTVEYQQRLVYRRFLPPNTVELKDEAYDAADWSRQVVQRKLEACCRTPPTLRGTSYEIENGLAAPGALAAGLEVVGWSRPPNWCTRRSTRRLAATR